jgi:hypothetical protein
MLYTALINDETLEMTNPETGEFLDVVAVLPGHAPDMEKLLNMLSPEEARQLARMAEARADGFTLAIAA